MKRLLTTACGLMMLGSMTIFLVTTDAAVQDSFWAQAAQGNMMEIAAANAALQRSQNEQVKQFAQQMVTEHTAMGTELQTLATSKSATLPTALDAKHQSDLDKLGGRSGTDFDRDFMKMMVKDHERMAKLLEREAARNADADVKAFAAKNLPAVQHHLAAARTLNDSLRGSTGRSANENSSNSNRSANSNRRSNTNSDDANSSDNRNAVNTGFSNKRPNVNRNANTNSNTNPNRNTNTNGNSNNSNLR